jgi:hypothetical protein
VGVPPRKAAAARIGCPTLWLRGSCRFRPLPGIFAVLEEKPGLKLKPGKGPAEVLVVDSAEKPDTNQPFRVIVNSEGWSTPMHSLPRFETSSARRSSVPFMASRLTLALVLLTFSEIPLLAQFGNPYPGVGTQGGGMGIPGISLPGTSRRRNQQTGPAQTLSGKIKRISSSQLVLTQDDGRDLTISLDRNTRYYDTSGNSAKYGDFDNGDDVTVDASQDNQNFYHGQRVTIQHKYMPADSTTTSSSRSESGSSASAPEDNDPDRPKLKRASGSGGSSSPSSSSSSPSSSPSNSDSSTIADNRPATTIAPRPVPRESDDPGPPVLRRNAPARVDNTPVAGTEASEMATARPSIRAEDSNGVTRRPAPPMIGPAGGDSSSSATMSSGAPRRPSSGDPVIDSARDAAFEFTDTLPNYVVKQFTTRYQTDTAHGNRTSWQALDLVTADVVCENGKESYKNILVNGKAPRDAIEKSGSWSTGEFATVLQGILHPQTNADFHNKRSTTIVNRPAYRYDYSVEQAHSMWHVYASSESYVPGYTGSIWIDKETFRVLRIEMSAVNMPRSFALDAVESAVDYDFVLIGDKKALLPTHSEALSCVRGTAECTRNVIEFRNYKKFGADTSITFESDK